MDDVEADTVGVISAGEAYSLPVFKSRTGQSDTAIRTARRKGLPIRYSGNRAYILGADWLAFLAGQSTEAPGPAAGTVPKHLQPTG